MRATDSTVIRLLQGTVHVIIISNMRDNVSSGYPNTERRVENMMHSRIFLIKFEVFG